MRTTTTLTFNRAMRGCHLSMFYMCVRIECLQCGISFKWYIENPKTEKDTIVKYIKEHFKEGTDVFHCGCFVC